ncbi:ATP-binding cassette domain-containing protein, partial [Nocardioides sp. GCM10030258]
GRLVATRAVSELDHDSLIELILGRPLEAVYPDHDQAAGAGVLAVEHLAGGRLRNLTCSVRAGEIVGIVGLSGSGAEDVPHLLFGSKPLDAGVIRIDGSVVRIDSPSTAIKHGIAFAPGERKRLSAMSEWNVRENLTLPRIEGRGPLKWLSKRYEIRDTAPLIEEYDVRPASTESTFGALSGGNQQKVVIARWMRCGARIFLLEEPTAGVDVGAKRGIYDVINRAAADGSAVLLVTSDFEEAAAMCDRVIVMRNGAVGSTLSREEASVDRILGEAIRTTTSITTNQEGHAHV